MVSFVSEFPGTFRWAKQGVRSDNRTDHFERRGANPDCCRLPSQWPCTSTWRGDARRRRIFDGSGSDPAGHDESSWINCWRDGTGKTKTLQAIAEQQSDAGVPVFAAAIRSDLSGLAQAGVSNGRIIERSTAIGDDWEATAYPVEFVSLGADKSDGIPLRAMITSFGPILLSKMMGLDETQESCLQLMFHWARSASTAVA